jgi:hypothetical protein
MALKSFKTNTLNTVGDVNGLVHIKTESGTSVSAINVDGVFTAEYENYFIYSVMDTSAASVDFDMRLRVGGTTNTSANYAWGRGGIRSLNDFAGFSSGNSVNDTKFTAGSASGTRNSHTVVNLSRPFKVKNTTFTSQTHYFDGQGNFQSAFGGGSTSITDSYTGFTVFVGSGTFDEITVRVYGYKD